MDSGKRERPPQMHNKMLPLTKVQAEKYTNKINKIWTQSTVHTEIKRIVHTKLKQRNQIKK